jgi:PIN domain nuclease of toxin-antitoxin system
MQRFLLDTHVLLWWLVDSPELGPRCRKTTPYPFDRMLIAQAQSEGLILITADDNIVKYQLRHKNPRL